MYPATGATVYVVAADITSSGGFSPSCAIVNRGAGSAYWANSANRRLLLSRTKDGDIWYRPNALGTGGGAASDDHPTDPSGITGRDWADRIVSDDGREWVWSAADTAWIRTNSGPVVNIASTPQTLTAADSGKVFRVNVADCVFNLPATVNGLQYTFVVDTTSAGNGVQLSPVAADNVDGHTDNKDIRSGADARGDSITILGDGDEGWLSESSRGSWTYEP
jgi:hypothetical protein